MAGLRLYVMCTKDFSNLDLSGENLEGVDFSYADLRNTKLLNCNLKSANFYRADLWGAELDGSALDFADFTRADLFGAFMRQTQASSSIFTHAYMCGLNCHGSDLSNAIFDGAYMFGTNLHSCNLENSSFDSTNLVDVEFANSNFIGVKWKDGIVINRPPISIHGLDYPITIVDGWMDVGCQSNPISWYEKDAPGKRGIAALEGLKSARFWKKNKQWIFELISAAGIKKS